MIGGADDDCIEVAPERFEHFAIVVETGGPGVFEHPLGALLGVGVADGDDIAVLRGGLHAAPSLASAADDADAQPLRLRDGRIVWANLGGGGTDAGGRDADSSGGGAFQDVSSGEFFGHRFWVLGVQFSLVDRPFVRRFMRG